MSTILIRSALVNVRRAVNGRSPIVPWLAAVSVAAAAVLGVAELAFHRTLAPLLSNLPGETISPRIVEAVQLTGERAFHGTLVLIVTGALLYIVSNGLRQMLPALVAAVVVGAGLASLTEAPVARVLAQMTLAVAVAAIVGGSLAGGGWRVSLPVAAAGVSIIASRLPLIADEVAPSAIATERLTVGSLTIAEASFVAVPVLIAIALARLSHPSQLTWVVTAVGAMTAAMALTFSPFYTAILSTWATGVTLALPVPLYIVGAGAAGFVLATALSDRRYRMLGIGLLLLAVAGAQPTLVHHNITAVLALVVLVTAGESIRGNKEGIPARDETAALMPASGA